MTSAADKYGKLAQALSGEAHKKVLEAGQVLQKNNVTESATLGTSTRPDATPPVQTQNDSEPKQRGLTR